MLDNILKTLIYFVTFLNNSVLKYKLKFSDYVLNNCDVRQGFEILERFAKKYFVLFSNIDEYYHNKTVNRIRKWATFYRVLSLIIAIRFLMPLIFNNNTFTIMLMDVSKLSGKPKLISSALVSMVFILILGKALLEYTHCSIALTTYKVN